MMIGVWSGNIQLTNERPAYKSNQGEVGKMAAKVNLLFSMKYKEDRAIFLDFRGFNIRQIQGGFPYREWFFKYSTAFPIFKKAWEPVYGSQITIIDPLGGVENLVTLIHKYHNHPATFS